LTATDPPSPSGTTIRIVCGDAPTTRDEHVWWSVRRKREVCPVDGHAAARQSPGRMEASEGARQDA
jgi:hypothetical protein